MSKIPDNRIVTENHHNQMIYIDICTQSLCRALGPRRRGSSRPSAREGTATRLKRIADWKFFFLFSQLPCLRFQQPRHPSSAVSSRPRLQPVRAKRRLPTSTVRRTPSAFDIGLYRRRSRPADVIQRQCPRFDGAFHGRRRHRRPPAPMSQAGTREQSVRTR